MSIMRRLISEEDIKINSPSEWCKVSGKLFVSADFAEEKLKNIAIDFHYWAVNYRYNSVDGETSVLNIFEKFIEQRCL